MKTSQLISLMLILLTIITGSCSKHLYEFNPESVKLYPSPPDTAKLQFLTSISSSLAIEKQRTSFGSFFLGELPVKTIIKPYGITSHPGKIYICDAGIRGIEIIDLEKQKFEYFTPKGKGQLKLPLNCCLDDEGNLYVADARRQQVVIFDPTGTYLEAIGDTGNFKPTDVAVSGDLVFVADLKRNQIAVYNKDSQVKLYTFPNSESGKDDFLYSPTNIYLHDSIVYVSDMGDAKVKKYSLSGKYIDSFGSYGKNIGQFTRIKGIAVDRESNVYAVDAAFENVQIFNDEGQLLLFFGGPYSEPGDMWLPAKVAIDYENREYFTQYVDPEFTLKYLVYVTNLYGPDKVNVYGFIQPKEK